MMATRIEGIAVEFDSGFGLIAQARGIWNFTIVYGPALFQFQKREQHAILLHEAAHCRLGHVEKRLRALWRLFARPRSLALLCREQEFEADAWVANRGYGRELASALARMASMKGALHPSNADRIIRLLAPA